MLVAVSFYFSTQSSCKLKYFCYIGTNFCVPSSKKFAAKPFTQSHRTCLCLDHTSVSGLPETSWCGETSDNHFGTEPCPRGPRLEGRLHAEFRLFETSALSSLSVGCRQAIDCRVRVRDGGFLRIFLEGDWSPKSDFPTRPSTDNIEESVYYYVRRRG